MEKNIWEDKNPWQKYFENGTYNLGKMKNWRGKFFASNKEIEKFILKNVRPNGRSKTDFYRRLKKFLFLR